MLLERSGLRTSRWICGVEWQRARWNQVGLAASERVLEVLLACVSDHVLLQVLRDRCGAMLLPEGSHKLSLLAHAHGTL